MKAHCPSSRSSRQAYRGSALSAGEKRRLSLICCLSIIVAIVCLARAAHSATPPVDHQFVKSDFVNKPGFGKDPFFPRSQRRGAVARTTPDVEPTPVSFLVLKGISGPRHNRLAIINNRTFAVGEEAEIKTMGQSVRVKCTEIRDDGVVVTVNGQTQKLFLGPKL